VQDEFVELRGYGNTVFIPAIHTYKYKVHLAIGNTTRFTWHIAVCLASSL